MKTFGTSGENDWTSNNIGIDEVGTIWVVLSSLGRDNYGQNYPVFYGSPNDSLNLSGNQDTLIVRGVIAYGFTAVVNPKIYARNDFHSVSQTSQQMMMVIKKEIYPTAPV